MKNLKALFTDILSTKNSTNIIFIRHAQSMTGLKGIYKLLCSFFNNNLIKELLQDRLTPL